MRCRCLAERCNRALCSVCRRRAASQLETGSAAFCPAAHEQWDRKILTRTRARSNGKVLYRHQRSKIFLSKREVKILREQVANSLNRTPRCLETVPIIKYSVSGKMHNSWVTLPACVMTRGKQKKKKKKNNVCRLQRRLSHDTCMMISNPNSNLENGF